MQATVAVILPQWPEDGETPHLRRAFSEGAEHGAVMAGEEFARNAELFGLDFRVVVERAPAAEIGAAADRVADRQQLSAVIGGVARADAAALGAWAANRGLPFVNIAASSDALRGPDCAATTFHLAPSAAMYLDALAGWYVRAGFRRWYVLRADTPEASAQHQRLRQALDRRHFGAREVGSGILGNEDADAAARAVSRAGAEVLILLLPASEQLSALARLDAAGLEVEATGFPYPETQIAEFFAASAAAAPTLGRGFREVAWAPTLDAYGARELNARYRARWDEPMEAGAWAAYQAVKLVYEAVVFGGSAAPQDVLDHLDAPDTVFDLWKGIGTSFRPWDRQMRQPLYLVKVGEGAETGLLVGELPAIYMPGTDPVERLDQLGDLAGRDGCRR